MPAGVEPRRILAADAGWYAAQVIDLKHTHDRWFAVLRGGTHHFRLPAAQDYSHPFTVLDVDDWPHEWTRPQVDDLAVDAVGELCTRATCSPATSPTAETSPTTTSCATTATLRGAPR